MLYLVTLVVNLASRDCDNAYGCSNILNTKLPYLRASFLSLGSSKLSHSLCFSSLETRSHNIKCPKFKYKFL